MKKQTADLVTVSNIVTRAKSKTPKFFKNLQKICGLIVTIGTGLLAVPGITPIVGTIVIVAGTVAAGVSQLTKI